MGNQTHKDKDDDTPSHPSHSGVPGKRRDDEKPNHDRALDVEEPELPEGEDVPRKEPPHEPRVKKSR